GDDAEGSAPEAQDDEKPEQEPLEEANATMGDDFEIRIIDAPVEPEPQPELPPSLQPDKYVARKLSVNQFSVFLHRLTCIFIHARCFRDGVRFAEGSPNREVAGIIVGKYYVHEGV